MDQAEQRWFANMTDLNNHLNVLYCKARKMGVYYNLFGMNRIVSTTQTTADVSGQFKGPWLFKLQKLVSTFRDRKRGCLG